MAKLTGPLFSLGASGTIAKTITFGKWKGIPTARQRVVPSNPDTTDQQTQRGFFATCVSFWRGFLTGVDGKSSWNTDATASGKAQSGFNAFTSAAAKLQAVDNDASMVIGLTSSAVDTVTFDTLNIDAGDTGDEAGDFTLNVGSTTTQMLDSYTVAIVAGELIFDIDADYDAADVVYCQVIKTSGALTAAKRSGIYKVTLA